MFFHSSAPPDAVISTITQKKETAKEKFVDNESTTKIREKIMSYTLLLLFECMITPEMFLSLFSVRVAEEIVVMLLPRYVDSDFI